MKNKITIEQRLNFISGQITVLKYAFASLVVTHPLKDGIVSVIKKMPEHDLKDASEHFLLGIKNIVDEIDNLSRVAILAEASRKSPDETKH